MTHQDFYNTISKKNKVLSPYKNLSFTHNNDVIYSKPEKINYSKLSKAINVCLFPSYLKPKFIENVKTIIVPQKKIIGFSVLIKPNTADVDTFLKQEYKKSFRTNILRFVRRFETCFDVKYQLHYGTIEKKEYLFLMEKLHEMLINRFNQRNDTNKILLNWNEYLNSTFNLIKEKKASLFVIYNNSKPVHICINHHYNNIMFVSVPSYDVNYSKFALGNISLYKLLEWCINNNYEIMDMAYGYLEYKRRWSNYNYEFNHHIIYQQKGKLSALIEKQKLKFKNWLKDKNIDDFLEKLKKKLRKTKRFNEISFSISTFTSPIPKNTKQLNIYSKETDLIQKPINDFLYANKQHNSQVNIYEILKNKEYIISTSSISQKIIINKL